MELGGNRRDVKGWKEMGKAEGMGNDGKGWEGKGWDGKGRDGKEWEETEEDLTGIGVVGRD